MDPKDFTAEGIRARLQRQRDALRAEERAQREEDARGAQAAREAERRSERDDRDYRDGSGRDREEGR